jgi:formylmethanofuran dehydrogenase subunit E
MINCDLCGYEQGGIMVMHNGRMLCDQCYQGEIENPEHELPSSHKEDKK